MISDAMRWRNTSPTIRPANGASDQIGSERKPVEQTLAEVGAQPHARIHGIEHHRLHQDARHEKLHVPVRGAGQRAIEHERDNKVN